MATAKKPVTVTSPEAVDQALENMKKADKPAAKAKPYKLLTVKEMDEAYSLLSKTQTELNALIQRLAINAIGYSIKHGDVRPATRLIERFDGGLRKQTLVTYLEIHGYLEFKSEGKSQSFVINRGKGEKEFEPEKLEELLWYKAKGEVVTSIYDVKDVVQKFLKSVQSRTSGGKTVKNVSLAVYVQDAFDQWTKDQAEAMADRKLSPAEQANVAQDQAVTDVASEVEAMEQKHAPLRRAADRKIAANAH